MPVNLVGLGLLVAGVIFIVMAGFGFFAQGGVVLWIIGVVCLVGGVGALFMTFQRNRRLA
jgi:drug/metabolite transporter (DMT)-like permease